MKNHYEKAFWVFLNHPLIFEIEIACDLPYNTKDVVGTK